MGRGSLGDAELYRYGNWRTDDNIRPACPICSDCTFKQARGNINIKKQEVLGRTIRLLSLVRHGPHRKGRVQQLFYCYGRIRCRCNVFTKPLPSNDRGIHI
jgi:hypothetical protein